MEDKDNKPTIQLYTDGGADPNPGAGGYGVVLRHGQYEKELSQGYILTTNNRMELMAVIEGLSAIKKSSVVEVYSDSKYIVDAINKGWAAKWRANKWYRNKKEKAQNPDLWEKLLNEIDRHDVTFHWVKGHDGHPENERCDELATEALNQSNLLVDEEYEQRDDMPALRTIKNAGDHCFVCQEEIIHLEENYKIFEPGQRHLHTNYLQCPTCNAIYLMPEERIPFDPTPTLFD